MNPLEALKAAKALLEAQGLNKCSRIGGVQLQGIEDAINKLEKPEQLDNQNFANLRKSCRDYIDFIYSEDYHEDSDHAHYIYEEALQAVYGKTIWDKINDK